VGQSGSCSATTSISQREIRRITIALVILAAVSLAVINVWVYRNNRARAERQGWRQLIAETDAKRDEAARLLDRFRASAGYVVGQPAIQEWARQAMAGVREPETSELVLGELRRAQTTFDFLSIALLRPMARWR
jgi:hypothetical protein